MTNLRPAHVAKPQSHPPFVSVSKSRLFGLFLVVVLVQSIAALGAIAAPAESHLYFPLVQTRNWIGHMAYVAFNDKGLQLEILDANDSAFTRRTAGCAGWSVMDPVWSPNGQQIIFESSESPGEMSSLCVFNADGSGLIELPSSGNDRDPSWSPDGRSIVFVANGLSFFDPEPANIYVINADGSNRRPLVTSPGRDFDPVWSPDGTSIAFVSIRDGHSQIYLVAPDGSTPTRLTGTTEDEFSPEWSPDGRLIAFVSGHRLDLIRRDGTQRVRIVENLDVAQLLWSPDGRRIAFARGEELYVVNVDGTELRPLASFVYAGNGWGRSYAWSPDSRSLVYEARDPDELVLMLIDVDGSNQRRLRATISAFDPAWMR
jgi:Tol biopolymer transport system component